VFLSTINTQPSTGLVNFSDKEKDEAGLSDGFRQDSLDAFILRFAGVKAFLFFALVLVLVPASQAIFEDENEDENEDDSFRAGLSTKTRSVNLFAEPN
jgi:preprotein translocase subunit SecG